MADRLCLVEDDPTIREIVSEKLRAKGFDVEIHSTAEEVYEADDATLSDLYILDVLLPGQRTGLDLCRKLKARSPALPVLILSALSEPADRVEGLKVGADDYLTKPFEMEELLLRVQGMLRRRSWYSNLPQNRTVFEWDGNSIDFETFAGRKGFDAFEMTQKECMLMKLLVEKEGQVVSRDEILDQVWGYNVYPSTRTVDNFILRLRKYFEPVPSHPKYIHSVRGTGYRFTSKGQT